MAFIPFNQQSPEQKERTLEILRKGRETLRRKRAAKKASLRGSRRSL